MKSMLVIDSPTLAKLFAEVFERLGWTVTICNTRDCAMRQVAGSESYNVILLSHHLSGTDGVQLTRFIRSLESSMTTAVVMLTSNGAITDEAKAAGVDEVLIKPVNVSTLIWAVNKHVS
jgi:DNA-binding response OmpR family regulator